MAEFLDDYALALRDSAIRAQADSLAAVGRPGAPGHPLSPQKNYPVGGTAM